jgi:hypothetical protein
LEADIDKDFPMRLLFPKAPELRYERMAIAFFVSVLCFFGGRQFSLWALGGVCPTVLSSVLACSVVWRRRDLISPFLCRLLLLRVDQVSDP